MWTAEKENRRISEVNRTRTWKLDRIQNSFVKMQSSETSETKTEPLLLSFNFDSSFGNGINAMPFNFHGNLVNILMFDSFLNQTTLSMNWRNWESVALYVSL